MSEFVEGMGRMKERRLERVSLLSDSWTDGSHGHGVVPAVDKLGADWMAGLSEYGGGLDDIVFQDSKLAIVA